MSRWIRAFIALSLPLTLLLGPTPTAHAQVSLDRLAGLQGRVVVLERYDGTWLLVRILRVGATHLTVELEDGLNGTVPVGTIAKVRLHRLDATPPSTSPSATATDTATDTTTDAAAEKARPPRKPHQFRTEWIGLRFGLGSQGEWVSDYRGLGFSAFAELTLFTLHWRHFYWEILRAGGGTPHAGYWGTAIGYPFHLDDNERHELRLGVHLTFWLGYLPTLSGVQLYYTYRLKKRFAVHIGLMQTSYPFSVTAIFGISM